MHRLQINSTYLDTSLSWSLSHKTVVWSIFILYDQPHKTYTKLPQSLCPLVLVRTIKLLYELRLEYDCHNSTEISIHGYTEMYGSVWYCTDFDFCATIFLGICVRPYSSTTHLFSIQYNSNKCCSISVLEMTSMCVPSPYNHHTSYAQIFSFSLIAYKNLTHTQSIVSLSPMISAFIDFT